MKISSFETTLLSFSHDQDFTQTCRDELFSQKMGIVEVKYVPSGHFFLLYSVTLPRQILSKIPFPVVDLFLNENSTVAAHCLSISFA